MWTEEQAKELLTLACRTNHHGEYIAQELSENQTLENLYAFGARLARIDEEHAISVKKPEGMGKVEVAIEASGATCEFCGELTEETCEECGCANCSGFLCKYHDEDGRHLCMACHDELD